MQKAHETLYAFLKVQMLALCGQMWWRKPENPEKTTSLGWANNFGYLMKNGSKYVIIKLTFVAEAVALPPCIVKIPLIHLLP